MANIESKNYRLILDHSEVLANSITQVLLTELVASGKFTKREPWGNEVSKADVRPVAELVGQEVRSCFDGLIDKLQNS